MSHMTSWNDRKYYSIEHDADVGRVSGYDTNHQEFWTVIMSGKGYVDRRNDAIVKIMESIEDGHEPGEVKGE